MKVLPIFEMAKLKVAKNYFVNISIKKFNYDKK